jgi:hypothetical protein
MSPAAKRPPKAPPPPKPWQRAEAGRHRSSDGRFTLEAGGGGWFVTDEETLDELGLARTTGPFATLDAAKAAADVARDAPAQPSPLAARIAEAAARPRPTAEPRPTPVPGPARATRSAPEPLEPEPAPEPPEPGTEPEPAPPPRTWLDDLEEADRDAAVRAHRLIAALEHEGVADAEAIVRRDLLGGTPAVATRLLARAILASIAALRDPSAAEVVGAVMAAVATSPRRAGVPGWELTERDGPTGERRSLRVTPDDLRAATEPAADLQTAAEPTAARRRRDE